MKLVSMAVGLGSIHTPTCERPLVQMSAFAEEMERVKVTEKGIVRDGKRLIRQDLKASQFAAPEPLLETASMEVICTQPPLMLLMHES